MGAYWFPIIAAMFGSLLLATVYFYTEWRKRLHEKGILDFRYDGKDAKPGQPITIFDLRRLEKEYDERNKNV